jgi:uncharacterized membrane protein
MAQETQPTAAQPAVAQPVKPATRKLVRCKACGYIMEEGKLGDKCPACGAPKAAFVPYVDSMSTARRNVLKLELHPIAVHFPISFVVSVLVFSIAIVFLSGSTREFLVNANKVLVLFIPGVVVIAGIVGFIDGKVRFHKVKNSAILKRKIALAIILLIVSIAFTVIYWIFGFDSIVTSVIAGLLVAAALGLIVALSLLGTSIIEAAFPGK